MANELSVLFDWTHTGAQSAGTLARPTPRDGGGELDAGEVAEIVYVEIFPPISATGDPEDLESVYLVLDGKSYEDYVRLSGRADSLMTPPKQYLWQRSLVAFGKPIGEALAGGAPALENTTPKYVRDVTVVTQAGSGGVNADYRIRIWGHRYTRDTLRRVAQRETMPGAFQLVDREAGKTLAVTRPEVRIDYEHWTQLPGGLDQAVPKINPLWTFARNAQATTPNMPYVFRFATGDVATEAEDLYWPFDQELKALILKGVGVRAPANLAQVWVELTGDPDHKEHPKGRLPVSQFNNPLHFGSAYPIFRADLPFYFGIPAWQNKPLVIDRDKAFVACRDNGTSIPANAIVVAVNGVLIEKGAS